MLRRIALFYLFGILYFVNSELIYVSPTGTTTSGCGSESSPCSLQYAIDNSSDGDFVHLLTGNYFLQSTINIQHTLTLFSNESGSIFTASGILLQNAIVTTQNANVSFINLIFQNIIIQRGVNTLIQFLGNGTVENCFFSNISSPIVVGAYNSNNTPNTKLFVLNSTFININEQYGVRGGINSYISVENSLFQNNTVNGATSGVVEIINGVITNCTFENNIGDDGSIISITNPENVIITKSKFNNNSAINGGVVTCIYNCLNVIIDKCNFNNNTAEEGGVFIGVSVNNITISNCEFTNNFATSGGVIHLQYSSDFNIISSIFVNNQASSMGGAIYSLFGRISIVNSSISNCSSYKGGGIYWGSVNSLGDPDLIITNSTFENCTAYLGGGIYNNGVILIESSLFNLNHANASGGAIYSNGELDISFSSFANNTVNPIGNGAGIFTKLYATISYSNFTGNTAKQTEYTIYGNGSAIYSSALLEISNCLFENNKWAGYGIIYSSSYLFIISSNIGNNIGENGVVTCTETARITDTNFYNNQANIGGGILSSNASIENCSFDSNKAGAGGAISCSSVCSVTNSLFTNNIAMQFGGAIFSQGETTTLSINNCSFISCSIDNFLGSVVVGGAAVYFVGSTLTVTNSIVDRNNMTAMLVGTTCSGSITTISPSVTILNTNFTNSYHQRPCNSIGGGLTIYSNDKDYEYVNEIEHSYQFEINSSINISYDSYFEGNSIYSGEGSAIYSEYPVSLYNYQFINNSIFLNVSLSELEESVAGEVTLMQKLFICSPTGNESFPCGRSKDNPCNLATIIPQIQNGTILSLLSGNYSLPLSFSLTGTHLSIIGDVEGGTNIITTPFIQLYSSFLYAEHLNFIGFEVYSTSLEDKSDAFIQIDSNSRFSLYHSSFQNITLSSVSMILSEGELELIDCTFQNNRIQDNSGERIVGSILLHYSSSPLTISQSLFDNNWISGEGECFGLIFVNGSRYTIDQSVVSNNYINCGYSIGVFILSSDENDIENSVKILSNSLFTNNTVTASTNQFSIQNAYGGGLWIRDLPSAFLSNSSLQLLNNTLVNNTAMYGGGVFLQVIGKDNNEEDWLNCDSLFDIMQYNKPANCSSNEKGMRFYQQPPSEIWPSFTFYSSLVFYDWFNVTIANPPSSISVSNPFGGNLLHSLTGLTRFPNYQYSNSDSSDSYIVNSNEIIEFYISISGLMNSGATLLFKSSQFIQSIEGEFILSTNITLSSSCAPNFEIVSSSCTLCEDDKYNFDGGNSCSFCSNSDLTPCLKYPSQGDQTIVFDVINIEAGYWPDQFTSPSTLIPCPMTNSCKPISCIIYSNQSPPFVDCSYCSNSSTTIATLADSLPLSLNNSLPNSTSNQTINYDCRCEDGYTNRLCSECICESISNCYYTSSNQCVQCTFLQSLSWWMIVILIVVGIIVTIIVIIIPKTTSFWMIGALLVCLIAGFTSFYSWSFLTLIFLLIALFMIADKGLPPGAVNSILYFLQTTTSLIDLHSWPQVMYPIIESFQISNLNFSFASCFWPKVLSNVLTQFISFYSILLPVLFFSILTAVPWRL